MYLNIHPSLGIVAGMVQSLQYHQQQYGGSLDVQQLQQCRPLEEDSKLYHSALELSRSGNDEEHRAAVYCSEPDKYPQLANGLYPTYELRFYIGKPAWKFPASPYKELFTLPLATPLARQLEIGGFLAELCYNWVTSAHMCPEHRVRRALLEILGAVK